MKWQGCWIAVVIGWLELFVPSVGCANPDTEFAVASQYYTQRNWGTAQREFDQFTRRNPNDHRVAEAVFYQAEAAAQLGNWDQAVYLYQRHRQQYPVGTHTAVSQFRLAEIDYLSQRDVQARPALEDFLQANPQHFLVSYALPYLGDIAWTQQRYEDAKGLYRAAVQQFPDGNLAPKCYCHLGMLFFRDGDWPEARKALRRFGELFPDDPLGWQAAYWLGRVELEAENFEEAAQLLARVADALDMESDLGSGIEASSALYLAGRAHRWARQPDAARRYYRMVQQKWPSSPHAEDAAYDELLLAQEDGSSPVDLRAPIANFKKRYPNSERLQDVDRLLTQYYLDQREFSAAEGAIARYVKQVPAGRVPDPHDIYLLAMAQLGNQQYQSSLQTLSRHAHAWDESLEPQVWIARASALSELGKDQEAIQVLEEFQRKYGHLPIADQASELRQVAESRLGGGARGPITTRPENDAGRGGRSTAGEVAAQLAIAQNAVDDGNLDQAIQAYAAVLRNNRRSETEAASALAGLGLVHSRRQAWKEAALEFEKLVQMQPNDTNLLVVAHDGLGRAYEELKQPDLAKQNYEQRLRLDVGGESAPGARLHLARWHEARVKALRTDPTRRTEMQREYASAVRQLQQFQKDYANSPEYPAALYTWAWLEKDEKHDMEAIRWFGEIAKNYPSSEYWEDAVYRMADYLASEKKFQESHELLDRLIKNGDDPEIVPYARYLQGQVLAGLARWDEIPAVLQPLTEGSGPQSLQLPARFWLAESWYRTERFAEAQQAFQDLAQNTQGVKATWVPMIPLRLAQIKALPAPPDRPKDAQDWRDALELATAIRQEFPNFPQQFEVETVRGRCLLELGQAEDARQAFQSVLATPTANGTETQAIAHWMIGETYYRQANYESALKAYRETDEKYTTYPYWRGRAIYGAGLSSEKLRRPQDAADYYNQIRSDPELAQYVELVGYAEDRLRKMGVPPPPVSGSVRAGKGVMVR